MLADCPFLPLPRLPETASVFSFGFFFFFFFGGGAPHPNGLNKGPGVPGHLGVSRTEAAPSWPSNPVQLHDAAH